MTRILLIITATFGFLAVAAGAFGAHALQASLSAKLLATFETAARYQMYHVLASLAAILLSLHFQGKKGFQIASALFLAGIVLFSGSLYIYIFSGIRFFVFVTPVGGLTMLAGWMPMLVSGISIKTKLQS